MSVGKVYLVGAGPGDPDLITRKGLRLIRTADVIVYDRLIPIELLDEARPNTELINVGKAPTKHRFSQDDINDALVNYALRGKSVVRLKGGDPFIFGRGSEEAMVLARAGIPFEIVPGISSSYGVPAYAGIPLTHRGLSTSFTVFTGHENPDDDTSMTNFEALARLNGTLVILMGVKNLEGIVDKLVVAGLSPDTPAAMIEWGTTAQHRVVEGTVSTLVKLAIAANIQAPATTVIGEVVALRQQGVQWFDLIQEQLSIAS